MNLRQNNSKINIILAILFVISFVLALFFYLSGKNNHELITLDKAMTLAKTTNKKVACLVYSSWLGKSAELGKVLQKYSQSDSDYIYAGLSIDIQSEKEIAMNYYKITGVPTIIIFNSKGKEIDRSKTVTDNYHLYTWLNDTTHNIFDAMPDFNDALVQAKKFQKPVLAIIPRDYYFLTDIGKLLSTDEIKLYTEQSFVMTYLLDYRQEDKKFIDSMCNINPSSGFGIAFALLFTQNGEVKNIEIQFDLLNNPHKFLDKLTEGLISTETEPDTKK